MTNLKDILKERKFKNLTRGELLVFAAEANSKNDRGLLDQITDELKARNEEDAKGVN